MDKVKAIKVLKPLVDSYVDYANISMKEEDDNIVEALEMAIEALDVPDMNVGDMISRQAVIDALDVLCQEHRYKIPGKRETYSQYNEAWQDALDRAEGAIFNLPTVQPDHNADISKKAEGDCISRQAAIDALNEYFARIGKLKRRGLTKGEKAISLDTVGVIENTPPADTIPVSWIEAKIELVNDISGVSMLKMKAADWVDLVKQWRAEQRNPYVDHDAQIRELAEEMQKHGVT